MEQLKTKLKENLSDSFDKELVDYAFRNLEDKDNPLKLNNFSYVLRELLYRILNRKAPHKEVVKCSWFSPMIKKEPSQATKVQQMQYLMLDHFPYEFVKHILGIDTENVADYLNDTLKSMNAYTHVNQRSINLSDVEMNKRVNEICTLFTNLFGVVKKIRSRIHKGVLETIDNNLLETMYVETFNEIDILSTHSTIESYLIHNKEIERVTDKELICKINGEVAVHLQYGSDSDIKNDKGYETSMSFPFTSSFSCTLMENGIENYEIKPGNIEIDTDSFYE